MFYSIKTKKTLKTTEVSKSGSLNRFEEVVQVTTFCYDIADRQHFNMFNLKSFKSVCLVINSLTKMPYMSHIPCGEGRDIGPLVLFDHCSFSLQDLPYGKRGGAGDIPGGAAEAPSGVTAGHQERKRTSEDELLLQYCRG